MTKELENKISIRERKVLNLRLQNYRAKEQRE
jgi:hypothetical protein